MTPIRQTQFSDNTEGDCLRAAIASLLDLRLSEVPHFIVLGHGGWAPLREWLRERDMNYRIVYKAPPGYAVGIGPQGKGYHAVVMHNDRLAHDPNGGSGLDAVHCYIVVEPMEPIDYELEAIKRRQSERRRNGWRP